MDVTVTPAVLRGAVRPPASKSLAHRLLIAAALSSGTSHLTGMAQSEDIAATMRCLTALGATFSRHGDVMAVTGIAAAPACRKGTAPAFDCGESGSTLRFLIPLALVLAGRGDFTGKGRLPQRPQTPYAALFAEKGVAFSQSDTGLTVSGTLTAGDYALAGDVSSQFFTGLLFSLPLLSGNSTLHSTTPLESAAYIDLTMEALSRAGVYPIPDGDGAWRIEGGARYREFCAAVEPDWSQAAFWYAAAFAGMPLTVEGMSPASRQGDRAILSMIDRMQGAALATIDLRECPDLLPPAAAAAALRERGAVTHFVGAARLRLKESDRLATVAAALTAMGAAVTEGESDLTVVGAGKLPGGCTIDAAGDHRIAMMSAVAACGCEAPVTITGAECVAKSYPDFWDVYERLGGQIARTGGKC
jgi:3-phosphoshikimate 1-carboxyvinyltransferase